MRVEQLRIALAAVFKTENVGGNERLERVGDRLVAAVIGLEPRLAHVRDVEQAGGSARCGVFPDDAGGILHRHVVAGERHHARACGDVKRMQRCPAQGFGWCRI